MVTNQPHTSADLDQPPSTTRFHPSIPFPSSTPSERPHRNDNAKRARKATLKGLSIAWKMIKNPALPTDSSDVEADSEEEIERLGNSGKKGNSMRMRRTGTRMSALESGLRRMRTRRLSGAKDLDETKWEDELEENALEISPTEGKVEFVAVDNNLWNDRGSDPHAVPSRRGSSGDETNEHEHHNPTSVSHPSGTSPSSYGANMHHEQTSRLRRCFHLLQQCSQSFFKPRFEDPHKEENYQKEAWYTVRQGAIISSLHYIFAFALTFGLTNHPIPTYNRWAFIFANGVLSVPLPFFVALDLMRKACFFYQTWVLLASWAFAYAVIINMYTCGFYTGGADTCMNSGAFIALYYWSIGLPVIGLLGLGQKRGFHLIGVIVWCALVIGLILAPGAPQLMIRNLLIFISIHAFLLMTSWFREKSSRKMFSLRAEVKKQYRATERARRAEAQANQNSKRFIAYVFHEIRGPLNRCALNFGLLLDELPERSMDKEKQDMVSSVTNDFQLMSRVLNDVLSLDRIALGMLEPSIEPFKFDQTVEQAVNGFRSQAQALKLDLKLEADPKIEELVLLGDSGRLRQLIENLTSNSFKFTREGSVTIVTKLLGIVGGLMTPDRMADDLKLPTIKDDCEADQITVLPIRPAELRASTSSDYRKYSTTSILSSNAQSRSNSAPGEPRRAIIRVEVRDTGVGFGPDDVKETELFSEYRQTKVGKKQGGSGSGLGLALCRKFIEVFGGRLGVESEAGQGSTFWFEVPLPIQEEAYIMTDRLPSPFISPRSSIDKRSIVLNSALSDRSAQSPTTFTTAVVSSGSITSPPRVAPERMDSETEAVVERTSDLAAGAIEKGSKAVSDGLGKPPKLDCLVVDDCSMTRALMSRILKKLGHSVTEAEDGAPALQLILDRPSDEQYDIVFLDNMMPVMTGEEAVRELRKRGSKVFVVGATGNALKEDQDAYMSAGVDEILTKPVFADKIKKIIAIAQQKKKKIPDP